jgi:hypothetical protein
VASLAAPAHETDQLVLEEPKPARPGPGGAGALTDSSASETALSDRTVRQSNGRIPLRPEAVALCDGSFESGLGSVALCSHGIKSSLGGLRVLAVTGW